MAYFRFRRSLRIAPGVRLNVSKTGSSVSFGGRGATLNVSRRGTRTTIGLPGSGLSYVDQQSWKQSEPRLSTGNVWMGRLIALVLIFMALRLLLY